MGKLGEVYSGVENPLDNDEILEKIILAYSQSDRRSMFGLGDLYDSMVKMNDTHDDSQIDLSDREAFFVETYNQWIENILSLDENQIAYLESQRGVDARKMQQYLATFGKVSSMEDIRRLKENPLFYEEINGWELNDGWDHIKSEYISGRTEGKIDVRHRLYIGCKNQDLWKLARLFKEKCEEHHIPFYFKLGASSDRDDKMVIYADTDNLANYISLLQEIAQENPEIVQRCGRPPILTGRIDDWIGIGDEPPKGKDEEKESYNSVRSKIFEDAIEETLLQDIMEYRGKRVEYDGKQVSFEQLFIEQAAKSIIKKINDEKGTYKLRNLESIGIKESDLSNPKFEEYLKTHLRTEIQKGLEKLIEFKDKKDEIGGSNGKTIFTIPTRGGKGITINTYDMDYIIKSFIPIIQKIDPDFISKIRTNIQERCRQNGIDETFCFQQGTRERFEQIDELQTTENDNIAKDDAYANNQGETGSTSAEKIEESDQFEIPIINITELINPEILNQRVKLPNGAEISAKQYIQESVAPYIPSDGFFVLKNGCRIPAIQYIEEYILGEGQEKYQGDIARLIRENTIGNDGQITINGRKINDIDIVDELNPSLMSEMVVLPNGVKIPASQYVQEIVAPYIPSNGKFTLKSNGIEISAKQYIEEFVMFEGQQKYGGDFIALLEATTMGNNGTIAVNRSYENEVHEGITITDVREAISEGEITFSEVQDQSRQMADSYEISRSQHRSKSVEEKEGEKRRNTNKDEIDNNEIDL